MCEPLFLMDLPQFLPSVSPLSALPQNTVDKWLPYSPTPHLGTPVLCSLMGGRGEHNRALSPPLYECVCVRERQRGRDRYQWLPYCLSYHNLPRWLTAWLITLPLFLFLSPVSVTHKHTPLCLFDSLYIFPLCYPISVFRQSACCRFKEETVWTCTSLFVRLSDPSRDLQLSSLQHWQTRL